MSCHDKESQPQTKSTLSAPLLAALEILPSSTRLAGSGTTRSCPAMAVHRWRGGQEQQGIYFWRRLHRFCLGQLVRHGDGVGRDLGKSHLKMLVIGMAGLFCIAHAHAIDHSLFDETSATLGSLDMQSKAPILLDAVSASPDHPKHRLMLNR